MGYITRDAPPWEVKQGSVWLICSYSAYYFRVPVGARLGPSPPHPMGYTVGSG